jgi:O-acetylhomoserine (thiol)-lyase
MQLGIRNDEAAALGEAAGIEVIMNRCPKIEFGRLGGELSWSGVNSGIIQNRAPQAPRPRRRRSGRPLAQSQLRVRDARGACRRRARPGHRRALDADLPDDLYVFDDVDHAASLFNLHNFGYIYSRLTNPTVRCSKSASPASKAAAPPSPPPRAMRRSS